MMKSKVVITGIGAVTSCGVGASALWQAVSRGRSAVRSIGRLASNGSPVYIGGEVPDFDPEHFMDAKSARRLDRSGQFALAAAGQAIADAGLPESLPNARRAGVFDGSSLSSLAMILDEHAAVVTGELRRGSPILLICGMAGNSSGAISMRYGLRGPAVTISHGSVSAASAIGWAMRAIENGELDIAIAGGTEAPLHPHIMIPFARSGVLSPDNDRPTEACRPFAADRKGFVMGEGAAYLVLESAAHAMRRGVPVYCRLAAFAEGADACHPTSPDPNGTILTAVIAECLENAGLIPDDVAYINAHGTATKVNDPVECEVVNRIFNRREQCTLVGSTKPITGHLLGACGAVEAALAALSLTYRIAPPTINGQPSDPRCRVHRSAQAVSLTPMRAVLSINSSFGGRNSCLAFTQARSTFATREVPS